MIRPKEFTFTSKVATQDRKKDSEKRGNIPKHGSVKQSICSYPRSRTKVSIFIPYSSKANISDL